MNIAVAYTEYQLVQIQSLINHYEIDDIKLITFKKSRIPNWLIDEDLYVDILFLPNVPVSRYKRITKPFVDKYYFVLKEYLGKQKANLMIGAQDGNTIYSLIKYIVEPKKYWSVEDGFANYYERELMHKASIFLKKILFRNLYGYKIDIAYGHGKVKADKSFRIQPNLSIDEGQHEEIKGILVPYLKKKCNSLSDELSKISKKYQDKQELIVTSIKNIPMYNNNYYDNGQLLKFHPNDIVPNDLKIDYINDVVPIEILIMHMAGLKNIRFDSVSTSILNVLKLNDNLTIEINFNYKGKRWSGFMEKLFALYPDRLTIT